MPFIKANDGTALHYKDWGAGRPVVLLHGWPLSSDHWEYQSVPLVEAGFRVITPDRRGFGHSGQPWSGYDYDSFANDVETLLEELDLHDVVLVGFSMGGGEVARVAGRGNARVAKAVLVSAVTPLLLKGPDNDDGVDGSVFDGMVAGVRHDRPSFLETFSKMFYGSAFLGIGAAVPTPVLQWTLMMAMQAAPKATTDCVRAFSATDFRADLARIRVPTLLIHGTGDQTVPIGVSSHKARALIPGATLTEYEGASHGLFFTERERLARDPIAWAR